MDSCFGAVGLEAHSTELTGIYEKIKKAVMQETDRPSVYYAPEAPPSRARQLGARRGAVITKTPGT